ncbi:MAG: hypothetical protein Q9M41_06730 [Paracoccaceae bacterium]|nr:hypothetical protein [Paracoccaceae bacterium]
MDWRFEMLSLLTLPSFGGPRVRTGWGARLWPLVQAGYHAPDRKLRLVSNRRALEFRCGDRIKGFDPDRDYIEIGIFRDEPHPRIAVEERPQICGVRVLMNDTVIADIMGVRELDTGRIVLVSL